MKFQLPKPVLLILAVGLVIAGLILGMETSPSKKMSAPGHADEDGSGRGHSEEEESIPRGEHGGWLFSRDDLRVEVVIFEKGVPPQFRIYPSDSSGKPIPLDEIQPVIELHRLDRLDAIKFKPSGDYLLGDQTVVEPHSFDIKILATWKGRDYAWNHSQIEARAEIPDEALKNARVTIETAGPASIRNVLRLAGEIGLNEERVAHIVPRLDGVVKKVFKDLGDTVRRGDVLAILESRELADAKINYLSEVKKDRLATADLKREMRFYKNTAQMLDLLKQELELDEIYPRLQDLFLGQSRELLIPAYAKLKLAKSVYAREKGLFEKGISSKSEYLLAAEDYKSAEAKYVALREKIAYDGAWTVRQKRRTAEMERLNLQTATQKLLALGLTSQKIKDLDRVEGQNFTQYELRSSLNGVVIKKHLTLGEAVEKDDDIFLLANLSDVWVNIAIPAKDIKSVRLGNKVLVKSDSMGLEAEGEIAYLGSIIDEKNRAVTGRVVIENANRKWRPGTFVSVELILEEKAVPIAVVSEALQTLRDWDVVFVKYGNTFEARPLELGASDGRYVEVLEGLSEGERYVAGNSFAVKAEIEKSGATHSH